MTYRDKYGEFFGRRGADGSIGIYHVEDGLPASRLDASVYPVGSLLSTRYEHPEGIRLAPEDAEKLGLPIDEEGGSRACHR